VDKVSLYNNSQQLVLKIASNLWTNYRRLSRTTLDWDDLCQEALLSLWYVCEFVDETKTSNQQQAYIYRRVRESLKRLLEPEMDYIAKSITLSFDNSVLNPLGRDRLTEVQRKFCVNLNSLHNDICDALRGCPIDCLIFCRLIIEGVKIKEAKGLVGWCDYEAVKRIKYLRKKLKEFDNGQTN